MQKILTVLDLFSGIGGFSLGLERAGMRTVAFCEIESFPQKVLRQHWPSIPIAQDIRELTYKDGVLYDGSCAIYVGTIDVVCGGFPCQPFSVAGRKKGTQDDRDLWPQMFRLIQQAQPTWVIGENVAHFVRMAFSRTKIDLENQGYAVQPFIIPACAIGAPHRRDRVWIMAYSDSQRCGSGSGGRQERSVLSYEERHTTKNQRSRNIGQYRVSKVSAATAHSDHIGSSRRQSTRHTPKRRQKEQLTRCAQRGGWHEWQNRLSTPRICRSDDGIPHRVDRLKALGNAVVPQIPEIIGHAIIQTERGNKNE